MRRSLPTQNYSKQAYTWDIVHYEVENLVTLSSVVEI